MKKAILALFGLTTVFCSGMYLYQIEKSSPQPKELSSAPLPVPAQDAPSKRETVIEVNLSSPQSKDLCTEPLSMPAQDAPAKQKPVIEVNLPIPPVVASTDGNEAQIEIPGAISARLQHWSIKHGSGSPGKHPGTGKAVRTLAGLQPKAGDASTLTMPVERRHSDNGAAKSASTWMKRASSVTQVKTNSLSSTRHSKNHRPSNNAGRSLPNHDTSPE